MDLVALFLGTRCRRCQKRFRKSIHPFYCEQCNSLLAKEGAEREDASRRESHDDWARRVPELATQLATANEDALLADMRGLCTRWSANEHDDEMVAVAKAIGGTLHKRGGMAAMRKAFERLNGMRGSRTLEMWWGGIGDWRG